MFKHATILAKVNTNPQGEEVKNGCIFRDETYTYFGIEESDGKFKEYAPIIGMSRFILGTGDPAWVIDGHVVFESSIDVRGLIRVCLSHTCGEFFPQKAYDELADLSTKTDEVVKKFMLIIDAFKLDIKPFIPQS